MGRVDVGRGRLCNLVAEETAKWEGSGQCGRPESTQMDTQVVFTPAEANDDGEQGTTTNMQGSGQCGRPETSNGGMTGKSPQEGLYDGGVLGMTAQMMEIYDGVMMVGGITMPMRG